MMFMVPPMTRMFESPEMSRSRSFQRISTLPPGAAAQPGGPEEAAPRTSGGFGGFWGGLGGFGGVKWGVCLKNLRKHPHKFKGIEGPRPFLASFWRNGNSRSQLFFPRAVCSSLSSLWVNDPKLAAGSHPLFPKWCVCV